MRYTVHGGFPVPRDSRGYICNDKDDVKNFWAEVEEACAGLAGAGGCYMLAVRAGKGANPWYIGKAERQTFAKEVFTADKIVKYNRAMRDIRRGTPLLYFYARMTSGAGRFSRITTASSPDIDFLEKMLIGLALDRNPKLVNVRETGLLKKLVVPGLINSSRGSLPTPAADASRILGY